MPYARQYSLSEVRRFMQLSQGRNTPRADYGRVTAQGHARHLHAMAGSTQERTQFQQDMVQRVRPGQRRAPGVTSAFKNQNFQNAAATQAINSAVGRTALFAVDRYYQNGAQLPLTNMAGGTGLTPRDATCVRITLKVFGITEGVGGYGATGQQFTRAQRPGNRRQQGPVRLQRQVGAGGSAVVLILDLPSPTRGALIHVQTCYPTEGMGPDSWSWS